MNLDTPAGCVAELSMVNTEIAEFGHEWARDSGELAYYQRQYDRLYRNGLGATTATNAEKRAGEAHAHVEKEAPGTPEKIELLIRSVETHKVRFKMLERRASNAQSVLSLHRDEAKLGEYVT